MAKYVVTGALVQVKANTADGASALVYVYRGGVVDLDAKTAEHLTSVGLVEKAADVDTDPVVAAGPAAAAASLVDAPVRPADDADKSVWEAYAVRSGLPASDAEAASKEDLVAIFGGDGLPAEPAPGKRAVTRKS
jgi:hypothetical protein